MDQFLASQRTDGHLDSLGSFTLSPKEAREKMKVSGLSDPSYFALKIVQAAVAAQCDRLDVVVDRYRLRFQFAASEKFNLPLENIASALLAVASLPQGWLRHLAVGMNAAAASGIAELVWRTPQGSVTMTESELKVEKGRGPYELSLRKEKGLWQSLFGTQFAGEYATLSRRCRFAPLDLVIDGRPIDRPFPSRYSEGSGGSILPKADCYMWEAVRPGAGLRLAMPPSARYEKESPERWLPRVDGRREDGTFPLVVTGLQGDGPTTSASAVAVVLPIQEKQEDFILVKDGVTLEPFRRSSDRSLSVAVLADASDLSVDLTEFQVVEDSRYDDKLNELREWMGEVIQGIEPDCVDMGLIRLGGVSPQLGYDIRFMIASLGEGDIDESGYPLPASLGLLGITPFQGEQILLSLPAVNRFSWTAHLNCRAIATDQRLVFWDSDDSEYSWTLSWDQVRHRELKTVYEHDIHFSASGSATLEMALSSQEAFEQMKAVIKGRVERV
jgi:hypothetical protein